ncbi:MAG TPA: GAF domain-containing sensor histidine kinase [Thermoanaerobaculia bacterium]|nr:GAF domain-containing sensor histidine kinase [Thermoanaerobaculia bacterium]
MTLRRLKWITVLAALVFIVILEFVRRALYPFLSDWEGRLLMSAAVFTGSLFFFGALFMVLERMQGRLERQNRELLALHEAAVDVSGELTLDTILQRVVDQARLLVDARYGALSVIDDTNRIESFVTSGISAEERARIGDPPVGHGLLGVVLHEGHRLRTPDIRQDPRSVGFPPHHPPMRSLLAVPILCKGPFRGNLYLSEKNEAFEFNAEDEESLVRFATTAAIAIDNAYLHKRLNTLAVAEERLRIAHEMHDGLAQVLAYVNTKAQVVKEYLKTGRPEEAGKHLDQLAGAAREIYSDVRESIIGLRSAAVPDRTVTETLRAYVDTWGTQNGVTCRVHVNGTPRLASGTELQLLRIVQESLANIRKHAQARTVDITLEEAGNRLRLTVQDDGAGFVPGELGRSEFPRFGLATMRERAENIGGAFRLDSAPGEGTRVTVELPVLPSRDR